MELLEQLEQYRPFNEQEARDREESCNLFKKEAQ